MVKNNRQIKQYLPINEYGIIGDCHTAALIGSNGSIDWFCPTRFDSPAVFCRLLDADIGGNFLVAPANGYNLSRAYVGSTNVLQSIFDTGTSKMRMTDFMPVHQRTKSRRGHDVGTSRRILRLLEGISGDTDVEILFRPTFDYATGNTILELVPEFGALAQKDGQYLSLASLGTSCELEADTNGGLRGRLNVKPGEHYWLVITDSDDPDRVSELPTPEQCHQQLARTLRYWNDWSSNCTYRGPFEEIVLRSALTLKLLTYEPTGAIIAAPTTSLPEEIGGARNWDYRYSWIRDSALILYALMGIGYEEEAADFFEWLQEAHQNDPGPELQILYRIDGQRDVQETELTHLAGYQDSKPVRIGNAAATQLQLDIYGEILIAAHLYFRLEIGTRRNRPAESASRQRLLEEDWPLMRRLVDQAAKQWSNPDNGIWEVRNRRQHFLYSQLMCWAALDRGIRLALNYSLPASLDKWQAVRETIRKNILSRGYNTKRKTFVQVMGGSTVDASSLAISRVGFLSATHPYVQSTIKRIVDELTDNGLVYRYRSEDGLTGKDATFFLCTLWLVDSLALGGRVEEAYRLLEKVVSYGSDLGLFAEEIDSSTGQPLGNFPQGFTHMALINSAVNIAKAEKHGAEAEPETELERARRGSIAAKRA
jgi:GH15 family glucan-1,4-alpha-glucosidase